MHILIIPSWYPAKPGDIVGSFFREQAIAIHNKGIKVGVIAPMIRSIRGYCNILAGFGLQKEIDKGVATYRFKSLNITPRFNKLLRYHWLLLGCRLFKEYVKEHGFPDIVHVHSMDKGIFLAHQIYQRYGIPYLITEHSTAFAQGLVSTALLSELEGPVIRAKKRIAVSQPFARLLEKHFPGTKWDYVPNIVSQRFLDFNERKVVGRGFRFLNICFLTEKKRIDNLIKAFSILHRDYTDIQLIIGGDGPCRKHLEQLSVSLGVESNVKFIGMLSRNQVVEEMASSNAFVLSSDYETFGVVLVEALALGKPVIATRCGGPESIVNEEVGCLVEKNNVEALYEGMKSIYEHEYDRSKIKNYCVENFSERAVVEKLEEIYCEILMMK